MGSRQWTKVCQLMPGAHILAGFSLGFRFRSQLARLLQETPLRQNILTIAPATLQSKGIRALALDFDGVLAHHGAPYPIPEAIKWLKECELIFGGEMIFILSNKPTEERRQWFSENFPSFRFISGVRKKPYPDGLIKTGELSGIQLSSILMVDDRLLTGCLAALVAGARPCYIRSPYSSFHHRPFAELFFMTLRYFERILLQLMPE